MNRQIVSSQVLTQSYFIFRPSTLISFASLLIHSSQLACNRESIALVFLFHTHTWIDR